MSEHAFELGTDGPQSILVGVDGSRTSMRAAAYAGGLARRQGAALVVVHVLVPSTLTAMNAQTRVLDVEGRRALADELREELTSAARQVGLRLEFMTEEGDPYSVLCRIADERRVDAMVVGASESAGHRLVGSLAARLVRRARWPVTVVP